MNRKRKDRDRPDKSSNMEPAESSRETVLNSDSGEDLGTSSDRAMFDERMVRGGSREGRGIKSERSRAGSDSGSRGAGGITNRDLERERAEQHQLPERGRSQSEGDASVETSEKVMPYDGSTLRTKI